MTRHARRTHYLDRGAEPLHSTSLLLASYSTVQEVVIRATHNKEFTGTSLWMFPPLRGGKPPTSLDLLVSVSLVVIFRQIITIRTVVRRLFMEE